MSVISKKGGYDTLGAVASGLCLIHCMATPFLFIAHAGASGHDHHHGSPEWWGFIDIAFLAVSLLAVVWSARNSTKVWMKILLLLSWLGLAAVIFNEKAGWVHIPEEAIYVPALFLVFLHLYNRRYCHCADEECCENTQLKT